MNLIRLISFVILTVTIYTGCAHKRINAKVNVMRQEGGKVLAVSSSNTEAIAYDGAKVRAEEFCFKQGKDFLVVTEESAYQGADKNMKGAMGAVGGILGKNTKSDSLDDYKVKVVFKCDGSYTGKGKPFAETLDLSQRTTSSW